MEKLFYWREDFITQLLKGMIGTTTSIAALLAADTALGLNAAIATQLENKYRTYCYVQSLHTFF